jgi:hypothetical protein
MPWVGNQYIFPRAAPAYATWPAPPAPPAPPTPPAIPQRWILPEQIDGGNGDFGDPPDSSFGGTPLGPTAPGTDTDPDPGPPLGVGGYAPTASLAGAALSGLLGVPGLGILGGLLGSISDVSRAEEALSETYGQTPPGYTRVGYDPDLSTWGAFLDAVTPFGIFGESAEQQLMDEISHLSVAGLEGIGYGGFGVPGVAEREAAEAWGGFETAPFGGGYGGGPTATEMSAAMEDAYGGYGGGPGTGGAGPGGTGGGPGGGPGTGGGVGDDAGSPF